MIKEHHKPRQPSLIKRNLKKEKHIFACQKTIKDMKVQISFFKLLTISSMVLLLAGIFFLSCKKENEDNPRHSDNQLIPVPSEGKTPQVNYLMTGQIGHDGNNCPGCTLSKGKLIHRDCMGHGHYCRFAATVSLSTVGTNVTATTTDTFGLTSDDFFNMPDRSLSYTDENNNRMYLNIPEQLVFRDTATLQFTFTGLFFTDAPEYTNY